MARLGLHLSELRRRSLQDTRSACATALASQPSAASSPSPSPAIFSEPPRFGPGLELPLERVVRVVATQMPQVVG